MLVPAGATALVAAVTPYTHAAVGLAEYEIRTGSTTAIALADANSRLSQWVGTDIQTTLPAAPVRAFNLEQLHSLRFPAEWHSVLAVERGHNRTGSVRRG